MLSKLSVTNVAVTKPIPEDDYTTPIRSTPRSLSWSRSA